MPAAGSASAPAPTGGECDTVGVTASKDETLVDKSSNTNVANQAAVDHGDKSNHEVERLQSRVRALLCLTVTCLVLGVVSFGVAAMWCISPQRTHEPFCSSG